LSRAGLSYLLIGSSSTVCVVSGFSNILFSLAVSYFGGVVSWFGWSIF